MEQQGAQARAQQRGGHVQAGEQRHQNGGAEHGKGVLHTQDDHLGHAQLARVKDALVDFLIHLQFSSSCSMLLYLNAGESRRPKERQKKRH